MNLRLLLPLGLLLIASTARATPLVEGVKARLSEAPLLRGTFEQQKSVKGFKRPLESSGVFLMVKDRGVLWDTRKPFASTLTITPRSLRAEQGPGGASYQLETSREPALAAMNALLLSLVSGDVAALSKSFRIEGTLIDDKAWALTLTPLEPGLSRLFRTVRLEGDRHVRLVRLEEVSGDASVIRFSDLAASPAPGSAEAARLAR